LQSLNLCYSAVKDSHLGRLGSFPELEHLNLDSCYIEDLGIAFFVDNNVAPRLQSIELADTGEIQDHVCVVLSSGYLLSLTLIHYFVSKHLLTYIILVLCFIDVSDNCLEHLAKLPELSTLSLLFCDITNVGLRQIGKMTKLEVLNLDSRDISDFGLKHIENLDHLKSLDLLSSRITDSGCYTLSKIKSLETLALCGGGIGDVGCSHLSRLQNLNVLNLSQNEGITNRGAAALSSLKKLTSLNLSHTRVSADALVHFNRLKNLKSLALYGCGQATDRDRLVKLQNRLPNLRCVRTEKVPDDQGIVQDMSEHYSSSSSSSDMDIGYD
jgi:Leucine-rich repeat (LRR) protein